MLEELHVEDFAIIDRIDLKLKPGLITFTGETGAGKSILIDAIETLLGGRAEASLIRSSAERALIEGAFHIPEAVINEVHNILQREELLDDPQRVILGREIRQGGRNVARINGRSVNNSLLREIGELLVDIHGQSEHLSLLKVRHHLDLLDRYAGVEDTRQVYANAYQKLLEMRRELSDLRQAEQDASRRLDLLNYQVNEIETAHLIPGEDVDLAAERNRLANAESLASLAQEALLSLDEGTPETKAATDLLGEIVHVFNNLARLDASQNALAEQTQSAFDLISDISRNVRSYLENIEFNPQRLDQVEERLALIHNLRRKYGESIASILAFATQAHHQLDNITHASERIQELDEAEGQLLSILSQEGQALSQKRQTEAANLCLAIESELRDLHMTDTQFRVEFQNKEDPNGVPLPDGKRIAFDSTGIDQVEFLIAPNPGEGFKPLVKIASGGETSRLMLALKNVLARADNIPILIFDEIDQGIGGRTGAIVGQKLWKLARQHQVLCITHLPQLAAFGEQHFQVHKEVQEGRTLTQIKQLEGENRLFELAQMFGEISEGTLRSAHEILQNVAEQVSTSA